MDGNLPETIRMTAAPAAIGVAVSAAHGFAAVHRLPDDLAFRLAIVVEELVTNLVEHGGTPDSPIVLRLAPRNGGVAITLADRGPPFDPRDAVASACPPERGGGAGLSLVMAWATVEGYSREAGSNILRLHLTPRDADQALLSGP